MRIKLLSMDLIRRYGASVINADPAVANILIGKKLAVEVELENEKKKMLKKPFKDKMIKNPVKDKDISEEEISRIFGKDIIDDKE